MGRSGWRDAYSLEQHAREAIAVAEATGLFESTVPPILIGHSFGSFATRIVAHTLGAKLGGIVLVDGALATRDDDDEYDGVPVRGHRHRVYPTLEQAIARFRFEPAQTCDNPYILDFLARTSLGLTPAAHGGDGWSWRFDPDLRAKIRALPNSELLAPVSCRVALLFGDRSKLMTSVRLDLIRRHTAPAAPWIVIPDAGHHIMVDQPLALIAALRSLLEAWQPAATLNHSFNPSKPSVFRMNTPASLMARIGQEIGVSDWCLIDQGMIDRFADLTDDHQWIHVDREAAAKAPFAAPSRTVSSSCPCSPSCRLRPTWQLQGAKMGMNYGFDKVRMTNPVRSGSRIRAASCSRISSSVRRDSGSRRRQ